MGYNVDMELRNVKFKKEDCPAILKLLKKWNKDFLIPKSDWCRFDNNLKDPVAVFEEMRFSLIEEEEFYIISEFLGQNLGSHQELFEKLTPYLGNCEIVYHGEDHLSWKQVIKGNKLKVVRQKGLL